MPDKIISEYPPGAQVAYMRRVTGDIQRGTVVDRPAPEGFVMVLNEDGQTLDKVWVADLMLWEWNQA